MTNLPPSTLASESEMVGVNETGTDSHAAQPTSQGGHHWRRTAQIESLALDTAAQPSEPPCIESASFADPGVWRVGKHVGDHESRVTSFLHGLQLISEDDVG